VPGNAPKSESVSHTNKRALVARMLPPLLVVRENNPRSCGAGSSGHSIMSNFRTGCVVLQPTCIRVLPPSDVAPEQLFSTYPYLQTARRRKLAPRMVHDCWTRAPGSSRNLLPSTGAAARANLSVREVSKPIGRTAGNGDHECMWVARAPSRTHVARTGRAFISV